MMKLYDYWRSSAAFRVRIALNIKGVTVDHVPIDLVRDGGEQHSASYKRVNPQELVPALKNNGDTLTQSLAIIEYLDETHPTPALLPKTPVGRAHVRAMALSIAAEIHPLQNLRVRNYLTGTFKLSGDEALDWSRHWIDEGLAGLEQLVVKAPAQGVYCYGDTVTLADIVLVPQMYNARRFQCDFTRIPRLVAIDAKLRALPAFKAADPDNQSVAAPMAVAAGGRR
jgi:maleylpyruvate isomerase